VCSVALGRLEQVFDRILRNEKPVRSSLRQGIGCSVPETPRESGMVSLELLVQSKQGPTKQPKASERIHGIALSRVGRVNPPGNKGGEQQ
jgi:hypothetical protein